MERTAIIASDVGPAIVDVMVLRPSRDMRVTDAARSLASEWEHDHAEAVRQWNHADGVSRIPAIRPYFDASDVDALIATIGE